jgi:hypothetical protein
MFIVQETHLNPASSRSILFIPLTLSLFCSLLPLVILACLGEPVLGTDPTAIAINAFGVITMLLCLVPTLLYVMLQVSKTTIVKLLHCHHYYHKTAR